MVFYRDDEFFDELPVDRHSCRLLGPTALVVQGMMGLLVISSLVYKRHRESPKRPWRIWSFDVSKQVFGQMFVHGVNVLISGIVAEVSAGNACVLYFLNILIDTTLGVGIIYIVLRSLTYLLTEKCGFKGFESGQYGTPPTFNYWLRQTTIYVLSITTMKLVVVALFAIWPGIFKVGEWLLSWLGTSDMLQVIFTMGLFPIMMNITQFWLIDSIVKASAHSASVALPTEATDPDREPLFRGSIDDDEDDHHPHDIENPPTRPRSLSPSSKDGRISPTEEESKSSGATSVTAAASGSGTPKNVDEHALHPVVHAYPPSMGSTSSSPASSRPSSVSPPKRRRSPPPPLVLEPVAAIAQVAPPTQDVPVHDRADGVEQVHDEKEWAAWDEEDNWADRVGEEDWTGRRLDARKAAIQEAWTEHPPTTRVP